MKQLLTAILITFTASGFVVAQDIHNNPESNHGNKFEQLGTIMPTPNEQRTASGAPGNKYWQQRADYDIKCNLDEKALLLSGPVGDGNDRLSQNLGRMPHDFTFEIRHISLSRTQIMKTLA